MDGETLRGIAVVSVQEARKLGTVDDVLLDLQRHRLGGVTLQGGLFRGGPTVEWSAIRSVGQDAVMVDDSGAVAAPLDAKHSALVRLTALRGTKVVTDMGDLAGTIAEVEVDPASGAVAAYTVAAYTVAAYTVACSARPRATPCRLCLSSRRGRTRSRWTCG